MGYTIPSSPAEDPMTPLDGYPDVTFDGYMLLQFARDQGVALPYSIIEKGSVRICPGGRSDLNRLTVTLLVSKIQVEDMASETVIVSA